MNADDLERLDELRKETNRLRSRLESLRNASEVSAVNYSGTGVGSGTGDPVSRTACSAADIEEEMLRNVLEMVEIIDSVPTPYTRRVMRMRYINGYSWGRIAQELGYTDSAAPYRLLLRYRKRIMSKHPRNDNGMTMEKGVK